MIDRTIEQALWSVDETLRAFVSSDVSLLHEASQHIVTAGGKRIRPRVAVLAYLAAGGKDLDAILPMAAALELVHTATLVHDDINDHSLTRRGKPAVHARFGRTFALLTGDYLFAKVYVMMAPYGREINELMSQACVRLVEGETMQAEAAKTGELDRDTYKTIISRKTASLFEVGARMAAMLAEADSHIVEALSQYGTYLGLTFQIVDDILDIIGDPEALGKPVGADVGQGRGVLLTQNGRDQQGNSRARTAEEDAVESLLARLRESGAVEVARAQAQELAGRAREALAPVPDSPAKAELLRLVEDVLERER